MTTHFSTTLKSHGITHRYTLGNSTETLPGRMLPISGIYESILDATIVPYLYAGMGWGEPLFFKQKPLFINHDRPGNFHAQFVIADDRAFVMRTPHDLTAEESAKLTELFNKVNVYFVTRE